jgi:nicotinamide riboside kinase
MPNSTKTQNRRERRKENSMIGLMGASSTGKTTLAKAFVKQVPEIKFITSPVSQAYADLGVDPREDVDFVTRLRVQEEILNRAENAYIETDGPFISDRTPLDFIAYTLADVRRDNLSLIEQDRFSRYFERCLEVTNRHFGSLCLLQPGIEYEDDGRRPKPNTVYQEHINLLLLGLLMDGRVRSRKAMIRRDNVDLQRRVESLVDITRSLVNQVVEERRDLPMQ